MDRRKALKGLGLSLGFIAATPAVFSLLQSCTQNTETNISWTPVFFSKKEAQTLETLVDLILPRTEKYPGAADLAIHQFIDSFFNEVAGADQQIYTQKGLNTIRESIENTTKDFGQKEYTALLTKYLKASPGDLTGFENNKNETLILNTLQDLRELIIWAYKTTEKVGKEFTVYDPIPGGYEGCIPLSEATGGKAWTL